MLCTFGASPTELGVGRVEHACRPFCNQGLQHISHSTPELQQACTARNQDYIVPLKTRTILFLNEGLADGTTEMDVQVII
jgi:hypothetical protein